MWESTNQLFTYSAWATADGQIILITRDAFIFTPRSTVNESTGSVLINIITFVKGKLCKIIRVIFMISFLNVIYGGFS